MHVAYGAQPGLVIGLVTFTVHGAVINATVTEVFLFVTVTEAPDVTCFLFIRVTEVP